MRINQNEYSNGYKSISFRFRGPNRQLEQDDKLKRQTNKNRVRKIQKVVNDILKRTSDRDHISMTALDQPVQSLDQIIMKSESQQSLHKMRAKMISSLSPPRERNQWDAGDKRKPMLTGEIDIREIYQFKSTQPSTVANKNKAIFRTKINASKSKERLGNQREKKEDEVGMLIKPYLQKQRERSVLSGPNERLIFVDKPGPQKQKLRIKLNPSKSISSSGSALSKEDQLKVQLPVHGLPVLSKGAISSRNNSTAKLSPYDSTTVSHANLDVKNYLSRRKIGKLILNEKPKLNEDLSAILPRKQLSVISSKQYHRLGGADSSLTQINPEPSSVLKVATIDEICAASRNTDTNFNVKGCKITPSNTGGSSVFLIPIKGKRDKKIKKRNGAHTPRKHMIKDVDVTLLESQKQSMNTLYPGESARRECEYNQMNET